MFFVKFPKQLDKKIAYYKRATNRLSAQNVEEKKKMVSYYKYECRPVNWQNSTTTSNPRPRNEKNLVTRLHHNLTFLY